MAIVGKSWDAKVRPHPWPQVWTFDTAARGSDIYATCDKAQIIIIIPSTELDYYVLHFEKFI